MQLSLTIVVKFSNKNKKNYLSMVDEEYQREEESKQENKLKKCGVLFSKYTYPLKIWLMCTVFIGHRVCYARIPLCYKFLSFHWCPSYIEPFKGGIGRI
jgi:hypothetical protein